jgi:hypothetical protein
VLRVSEALDVDVHVAWTPSRLSRQNLLSTGTIIHDRPRHLLVQFKISDRVVQIYVGRWRLDDLAVEDLRLINQIEEIRVVALRPRGELRDLWRQVVGISLLLWLLFVAHF